ncbi:hypothetical protein EV421DRAFT_912382 [Armillaria borealis]|uniref:Uncharacterized protein n=1 Tax=Armillaria borealis TaxID=47425 RepID=A0AA39K1B7_9AGAR|nr:hypothetical protein EV421DRAFT_912382 [Armillaria borealis]
MHPQNPSPSLFPRGKQCRLNVDNLLVHCATDKQDKQTVRRLFESGVVQVLVASKDTAWSFPVASYMVINMGVQYYEGAQMRSVNVTDEVCFVLFILSSESNVNLQDCENQLI